MNLLMLIDNLVNNRSYIAKDRKSLKRPIIVYSR